MITENLDTFLNDFGVPVVFGAVSGLGLLDTPDEILGQISKSTEYQITVKASDFGAVKSGDSLTVNSVSFKARDPFKLLADGAFGVIRLTKV